MLRRKFSCHGHPITTTGLSPEGGRASAPHHQRPCPNSSLDLTSRLVLLGSDPQLPSHPQLSFACAQLPMIYFLNNYLYDLNHTLFNVHSCGQSRGVRGGTSEASHSVTQQTLGLPFQHSGLPAFVEVGSGWCPVHKLPPQRRLLEESLPAPTPHLHCGLAAV